MTARASYRACCAGRASAPRERQVRCGAARRRRSGCLRTSGRRDSSSKRPMASAVSDTPPWWIPPIFGGVPDVEPRLISLLGLRDARSAQARAAGAARGQAGARARRARRDGTIPGEPRRLRRRALLDGRHRALRIHARRRRRRLRPRPLSRCARLVRARAAEPHTDRTGGGPTRRARAAWPRRRARHDCGRRACRRCGSGAS